MEHAEQDVGTAHSTSAAEYAQRYRGFAEGARATAQQYKSKGDPFGESLALTRADVYEKAAAMIDGSVPADAADAMLENARRMHVRTPPLTGFEDAGRRYITARAWQFCAHDIDPTLEEKAPAWD